MINTKAQFFFPLVILLVLLITPIIHARAERLPQLNDVRDRAIQAGAYHFIAGIEQAMIPRPVPSMIGQTDQWVDIRIKGD
ncbi:MAG: hypothetical protein JXA42_24760 [Anaerolineales bacterium]|nr:hypothetical protein [Anaerolineales bacterium]